MCNKISIVVLVIKICHHLSPHWTADWQATQPFVDWQVFSSSTPCRLPIINSDHIINNNNMYIYSQHPYRCVNSIVLTLFLKQSKFDVLICSLNLFHLHGAA